MQKLHGAVTDKDHAKGNASAAVTLVEYGDYQCPDCGVAFRELEKVFAHYGVETDGGEDKLRFVFRNFPLEMHPMAEPAAEVAEYAATKGKFWEMHDAIFAHQSKLSEAMLGDLAKRAGLSEQAAADAMQEQSFVEKIDADMETGEKSGVHGTPTFFINGAEFSDDYTAENLIEAIDEAMTA